MKSLLLGCVAILLMAAPAFTQTRSPKPVRLDRYVAKIVPLEKREGRKWYTGTITGLSDTTISIGNSEGEWFRFSYNEIERIGTRKKGSGGIGAAIGFVAGAAFGAAIGSPGASSSEGINIEIDGLQAIVAGMFAVLGAPIGAAAGSGFKTIPIDGDRGLFLGFHHKLLKIKTDKLPAEEKGPEVISPVIQR